MRLVNGWVEVSPWGAAQGSPELGQLSQALGCYCGQNLEAWHWVLDPLKCQLEDTGLGLCPSSLPHTLDVSFPFPLHTPGGQGPALRSGLTPLTPRPPISAA